MASEELDSAVSTEEEEEEDGEEGVDDPAARPLAPAILKAPNAKQKPGKVCELQK